MPYSNTYKDVYFSTVDAVGERQHVFLAGIQAPACWAGRTAYVIGETGFGTGLNFLLTWSLWRQTRAASGKLFYIAVESSPLAVDDLRKAHGPYGDLAALSAELRDAYPVRHPGYHQVLLDGGRVELLLLFGEARDMLAGLSARVDAWYLDGFAPSRNPDIWSFPVFSAMAERSADQARIATYSTARSVQDDLHKAGFDCQKIAGFAGKRESLVGQRRAGIAVHRWTPWYRPATPLSAGAKVAVIGAGISGACMAAALRQAGADVSVVDAHTGPAGEASGNPAGLVQPRPGGGNAAYERLQTGAYFHALRTYDRTPGLQDGWTGERGVLSFARDAAFLERHRGWLAAGGLPQDHGQAVCAAEANAIAGVAIGEAATWFARAGTIDPAAICRVLLEGTDVLYGVTITRLEPSERGWALIDADHKHRLDVDAVVLANGYSASRLCPDSGLPLYAKRGQISYMQATKASRSLRVGLSYGGYATPAVPAAGTSCHVLGATYQQWPDPQRRDWADIQEADDTENKGHIRSRLPLLADTLTGPVVGGRATLRTTTTDHLPVVGPSFSAADYRQRYSDLRHGKPARAYPDAAYTPGLYVLSALGSRGFALAPLLARILVAEMTGSPSPVDEGVHDLVHPARFLVRQLKRG